MEIYITGEIGRITDYSTKKSRPSFLRKVTLPEYANPSDYLWDGRDVVYEEFIPPHVELTEVELLRKEMNERQDMTDAAMLELADIVLKGGD